MAICDNFLWFFNCISQGHHSPGTYLSQTLEQLAFIVTA